MVSGLGLDFATTSGLIDEEEPPNKGPGSRWMVEIRATNSMNRGQTAGLGAKTLLRVNPKVGVLVWRTT